MTQADGEGRRDPAFVQQYGPWAVVAGASEGTGRAFARQLASKGLNCLLIARRQEPLDRLADEIRNESGVECATASIDLSAADAIDRIVAAAGNRDVGLFVSNAGADTNGSKFLDRDIGTWVDLVRRNVLTTMQACHHFGRKLAGRGRGGLLMVNSYACYGGSSYIATYSATKAFDLCLAEGLWSELREQGVDVLSVVLGMTDTPAFNKLLSERGSQMPPGLADPEDVASFALANLKNGPVQNWGLKDDEAGPAPTAAAARRQRILMMEQGSKAMFGD